MICDNIYVGSDPSCACRIPERNAIKMAEAIYFGALLTLRATFKSSIDINLICLCIYFSVKYDGIRQYFTFNLIFHRFIAILDTYIKNYQDSYQV